jgi:hypothetical protein
MEQVGQVPGYIKYSKRWWMVLQELKCCISIWMEILQEAQKTYKVIQKNTMDPLGHLHQLQL